MEPSAPSKSPWYQRPAVWVFCATAVLRAMVLSRFADTAYFSQQTGDMKFYHDWANRLLAGALSDGHAFYGLPGYAYLLAGIYKVVGPDGGVRAYAVGFLQVLIEALTAVIIFRIARGIFANEKNQSPLSEKAAVGLAALTALGWALYVPGQAFSAILMPTCWVVCAHWFCISQAMKPGLRSVWHPWLGLGLLIGVMAMMVATILFAVPLLLARIGISIFQRDAVGESASWGRRLRAGLLAALLLIGGLFAGASPAWIHNYFIAHDPVFLSAHSGLNFWMGNSPGATGYPKIPAGLRASQEGLLKDSITSAERSAGYPLKRSEVSQYWSKKANDYIAAYPEAWHRLLLVKVRNFWNAFQYDDISVITILRERGVLWPGLSWGLVAALGLAGVGIALFRRSPACWVAAAVILHMVALMPVFITERYRLAAVPGLLILGSYTLWELWCALQQRRWLAAGGIGAISLGTAALVSLPTDDPALWALAPYNVGVKELDFAEGHLGANRSPEDQALGQAELAHAERHLNQAYVLVQGDAGIVFALGNLALDKNDPARARAFYQQAIAINPHFSGALKNLGYLAVQEEKWAEAEKFLSAAAIEDPVNGPTYYLLAKAQSALGKTEPARASIREAYRLVPNDPQIRELKEKLAPEP